MYKSLAYKALLHMAMGVSVSSDEQIGAEMKVNNDITHANCDPTEHQSNGYDCFMNGQVPFVQQRCGHFG